MLSHNTVLNLTALESSQSELFDLKSKYDEEIAAKYVCILEVVMDCLFLSKYFESLLY